MIEITASPIDHAAVTDRVRSSLAGAVCTFLGTVRELTGERRTVALAYEAYPEMALKKMAELEDEARRRWPIIELALVHRVGDLELGEVSVVVAVSCPHRQQSLKPAAGSLIRSKSSSRSGRRNDGRMDRRNGFTPSDDRADTRAARGQYPTGGVRV